MRSVRVTALSDVSLRVAPGEIFGLLGPNGAGKTTFIRILLSIIFPTAGSATMFDEPITVTANKARIGYLPENHRFPPYMTAAAILEFFGRLGGIPDRERPARIAEALELVGMTQWRTTRIRTYSKGMMQRLGIAQAILGSPDLVILDEPTDGVDPLGRKQIRDIMMRMRDQGRTIFLNSHLLSEVELVCDRVAILNKGRVVRIGSVSELTTPTDRFIIRTTAERGTLPPLPALSSGTATPGDDGTVIVATDDAVQVNRIIDALRAADVLIDEIVRERHSLEEMFINVIEEDAQ